MDVEVFRIKDPELLNAKNSHASPTPIVEGDRVYVHFGAAGNRRLIDCRGRSLEDDASVRIAARQRRLSDCSYGDLLIVNCDGFDEAFVIALDKQTGKRRWQTLRPQPWSQAYSTPLAIQVGDRDLIVSVGAFHAVGVRSAERP